MIQLKMDLQLRDDGNIEGSERKQVSISVVCFKQ